MLFHTFKLWRNIQNCLQTFCLPYNIGESISACHLWKHYCGKTWKVLRMIRFSLWSFSLILVFSSATFTLQLHFRVYHIGTTVQIFPFFNLFFWMIFPAPSLIHVGRLKWWRSLHSFQLYSYIRNAIRCHTQYLNDSQTNVNAIYLRVKQKMNGVIKSNLCNLSSYSHPLLVSFTEKSNNKMTT